MCAVCKKHGNSVYHLLVCRGGGSAIVSDAAETEAVVELLEVQFVNLVQLLDLLVGQKLKVGVHKFLV